MFEYPSVGINVDGRMMASGDFSIHVKCIDVRGSLVVECWSATITYHFMAKEQCGEGERGEMFTVYNIYTF